MYKNFRQIKAIEQVNKQRWLKLDKDISDESGIYVLTRIDENGIRYAYIGQAKHILSRLAQHLSGYQHIDLSLKKHGLWSENNIYGWDLRETILTPIDGLDFEEQKYIKIYADFGYQLRNKTTGSQGKGKSGIAENKPSKGYYDGKKQGYEDCRRYVATMFEKYLNYTPRHNKISQRKFMEFTEFLKGE